MKANVLVVDSLLLSFNKQIGMDIIRILSGVRINQSGVELYAFVAIRIEEPNFIAEFDKQNRAWTVSWKWSVNHPPNGLTNKIPEYPMSALVRQEYRHELETWLNNGWQLPYPEMELGPPKSLIPLMAVFQQNKSKVGAVLDFRELTPTRPMPTSVRKN